jgi:hypothetical protein
MFLDISIGHPGAMSDYLAFTTSPFKHLLETPGIYSPGLIIFGDNAYVNTIYMVCLTKGCLVDQKRPTTTTTPRCASG